MTCRHSGRQRAVQSPTAGWRARETCQRLACNILIEAPEKASPRAQPTLFSWECTGRNSTVPEPPLDTEPVSLSPAGIGGREEQRGAPWAGGHSGLLEADGSAGSSLPVRTQAWQAQGSRPSSRCAAARRTSPAQHPAPEGRQVCVLGGGHHADRAGAAAEQVAQPAVGRRGAAAGHTTDRDQSVWAAGCGGAP